MNKPIGCILKKKKKFGKTVKNSTSMSICSWFLKTGNRPHSFLEYNYYMNATVSNGIIRKQKIGNNFRW